MKEETTRTQAVARVSSSVRGYLPMAAYTSETGVNTSRIGPATRKYSRRAVSDWQTAIAKDPANTNTVKHENSHQLNRLAIALSLYHTKYSQLPISLDCVFDASLVPETWRDWSGDSTGVVSQVYGESGNRKLTQCPGKGTIEFEVS